MAKPQYIQDKSGRLAGSIGVGATDAPVEIVAPAVAAQFGPAPAATSVDELWAAATGAGIADDVSNSPEDLEGRLKTLDDLGLKAANLIMDLRDRHIDAKTSFRYEDQERAEKLAEQVREIHLAVMTAREQLRQARAYVEGEFIADSTPGSTAVIAADLLSSEATELAETITDKLEAADDPALRTRLVAASRHAAQARATIADALAKATSR